MFGAILVILAQICDELSHEQSTFPRILNQNGQNDLEDQVQWPLFSTSTKNIPWCMFSAYLVIPAQISDELSCRQVKFTDGQGRFNGNGLVQIFSFMSVWAAHIFCGIEPRFPSVNTSIRYVWGATWGLRPLVVHLFVRPKMRLCGLQPLAVHLFVRPKMWLCGLQPLAVHLLVRQKMRLCGLQPLAVHLFVRPKMRLCGLQPLSVHLLVRPKMWLWVATPSCPSACPSKNVTLWVASPSCPSACPSKNLTLGCDP